MKTSADYKPSHSVAILDVGNPGTGKTRLMMAFPTPGILDCDMNLNSAVRVASSKKFFFAQPAIVEDETIAKLINGQRMPNVTPECKVGGETPDPLRWLAAVHHTKELITNSEVKTICVDGLTILSRWLLDYCEYELIKAGINVKKEYLSKFQNFITIMTKYITMLRTSGKYVFVTCHQTADQNDLTKAWYYSLSIPGQLKDTLGGLFTDVWGQSTAILGDDVKYYINTRPTNLHVALKTSFDLDAKIDITNKTPDQIWSLLEPRLSYNVIAKKV